MTKDLLYFGTDFDSQAVSNAKLQQNFIQEIKEKFPGVQLEECYDEIHGFRQGVAIKDVAQEDYFIWAISRGWASCSLRLSLLRRESMKDLIRLTDNAKALYPEAFAD